jgi:hypothetical protein
MTQRPLRSCTFGANRGLAHRSLSVSGAPSFSRSSREGGDFDLSPVDCIGATMFCNTSSLTCLLSLSCGSRFRSEYARPAIQPPYDPIIPSRMRTRANSGTEKRHGVCRAPSELISTSTATTCWPQRLKPLRFALVSAWLKPCPSQNFALSKALRSFAPLDSRGRCPCTRKIWRTGVSAPHKHVHIYEQPLVLPQLMQR